MNHSAPCPVTRLTINRRIQKSTESASRTKGIRLNSRYFIPLMMGLVFLFSFPVKAQVSVDATSFNSATSGNTITVSHTTGSGSDRLMLIGISSRDRTVTGVTVNGSSTGVTSVGSQTSNANAKTAIYRLIAPPTGSYNVVVTFSGNVTKGAVVGVMTFTEVHQTVPLGTYASGSGKSTNASLTVTSSNSELVFNVVSVQNQNAFNTAGQTQHWNVNTASECTGAGCTKPGSASASLSWTLPSDDWSMSGVSIKPLATCDLEITKTANTLTPTLGGSITFTLSAKNNGPDAATGVTVNDLLPNGFTYSSHSTLTGSYVPGTGVWTIGNLANGATVTLTITASVACSSNYKNIATILGTRPDPETGNNTSVLTISPTNSITTTYYVCEGSTYNLTQHNPCNIPAGTNVTWHTSSTATSGNKVGTPSAVTGSASPGTIYYVAFEDATNSCYSPTTPFTIINYPTISASLSATSNPITCNGGTTTLTTTATGGTSPYQYSLNGGPYQAGNTFTVSAGGPYTVTVKDVNNCTQNSNSLTITELSVLSASVNKTNALCNGGNSGTITISSPQGGSGTYEYRLNTDSWQSSGSFTGLSANTYSVQIRDAAHTSCVVVLGDQIITEPTALAISITSQTNVLCNGGITGSVTVSGNGGTAPYTYSINGTDYFASGTFTGLSANTYTLYVKDANNCGPVTTSVTITQPLAALGVTPAVTQPTCYSAGSISLSTSGGTSPYTYDWADLSGSNNPKDRFGLDPGSYTVTITDANGCTLVSGPHVLNAPVNCIGIDVCRSDLASVFYTTPDPANTSYTWTVPPGATFTGDGTPSISINWTGVTPGAYQVCVTAHNICGTSSQTCQDVYVNEPLATASADLACEGGDLQLYGGGGSTYAWSGPNGFTSSSANPIIYGVTQTLNGGIYTLTVTSSEGCTATTTVSVTVQPNPSIAVTLITDAACGQASGAVDITASGGTPGYTYTWSTGAVSEDISNVFAGNYSVTVTDNLGCKANTTASVGNIGGPTVTGLVSDVSCYGYTDGEIDITVNGGTSPYTYLWSNGSTLDDLTGLAAGNYSIVVTDALGCKGSASFTVNQPDPLSLDYTSVNVNCFDGTTGSIDLIVSGGTSGYHYTWTKDGNPYGGDTQDLSTLGAGTYSVTVTDAESCTANTSITITQPAAALSAAPAISHVSCYGGSDGQIVLTVSGGTSPYTYDWADIAGTSNPKDRTGLIAGTTYTVTVTDAKSCTQVLTNITVTEPPDLTADASIKTDVSCYGGSDGTITLSVGGGTGPYSYLWSNGATTQNLSGLGIGTYSVTVTDSEGCTETASNTITQPTLLTASATPVDADCYGASTGGVTLTVGGGTVLPGGPPDYNYLWSNNATTKDLAGVPAGPYTVTVTDNNGCTAVTGATVTQPAAITVSGAVTSVLCNGDLTGAIDLTVGGGAGGFSYAWADGPTDEDRTGLGAGTYTVTVTDANLCQEIRSYTITQPSARSLSMVNSDISCFGGSDGSINLTVSGGISPYTFLWSNNATTEDLTGLTAGAYTVTVTDANLCVSTLISSPITQPAQLNLSINIDDHVTCLGGSDGSLTASASGGTASYAYSWSNGVITATNAGLIAGTYSVTVTDAKGCTDTDSELITEPATEIELYANTTNSSACGGSTGSIDLTVVNGNDPFDYQWSDGPATTQDRTGLAAGSYSVTVTDDDGCQAVLSGITIGSAPALSVTVTVFGRSCQNADGSAYAIVTGGVGPYTYSWTKDGNPYGGNTQSLSGLDAGLYTVSILDANNCPASGSGTVSIPASCLPPVAVTDYYSTPYLTPISGTVITNDYDPDQVTGLDWIPLTIPTPEQGTIAWDPSDNGSFTYTPAEGFWGTFFVVYQLCDTLNYCDTAKLVITVGTQADLSITKTATPDPALTGQALTYTIVVTNNGPTAALDVVISDNPAAFATPEYSLTGAAPWTTWTGSLNIGTLLPLQTFTLYLYDTLSKDQCAAIPNTASVATSSTDLIPGNNSVTINTNVTDQAPLAVDDDYTMVQNLASLPSSLTANVLNNDSDFEGHAMSVSSWGTPSPPGGSFTTNSNGSFTYVPPVDYTGTVTFNYTVCDNCVQCDTATVTIHILKCLVPPDVPGNIIMTK